MQFFLKAAFDILFTIGSCDSFSFSKIAGIPYSLILGQFSASLGIDLGVSKLSKLRDVRIAQKGLIPSPSTSPFWHRSVLHPKFIIMDPLPPPLSPRTPISRSQEARKRRGGESNITTPSSLDPLPPSLFLVAHFLNPSSSFARGYSGNGAQTPLVPGRRRRKG